MDIRKLNDTFFVSPQIDPTEMQQIKNSGITKIICNRPDAEVPASHQSAAIEAAAKQAGLAFVSVPLTHQTLTPENIAKVRDAAQGETVLAYCASGTRSTIAWALGQAGKMQSEEIVKAAADAGYDVAGLGQTLNTPFA